MNDRNQDYAEVARAKQRGEAIEEAFRAILRADFIVAERCLARAQQEHYSGRNWLPGCPIKDVIGNSISYKDFGSSWRYRVALHDEKTNAHVRVLQDGSYHPRFWEAWAKTAAEAQAIAKAYMLEAGRGEHHQTSSDGRGEWIVLKYETARPALD